MITLDQLNKINEEMLKSSQEQKRVEAISVGRKLLDYFQNSEIFEKKPEIENDDCPNFVGWVRSEKYGLFNGAKLFKDESADNNQITMKINNSIQSIKFDMQLC